MRIFLAYRREDSKSFTGRIGDRLKRAFGEENVFVDYTSIDPGERWREKITDQVNRADAVLVVIGPKWLGSAEGGVRRLDVDDDCHRFEIAAALKRRARVIPLTIDNTPLPNPEDLPEPIRGLVEHNAFSIRDSDAFERDIAALIQSLGGARPRTSSTTWLTTAWQALDRFLQRQHSQLRPRAAVFQKRPSLPSQSAGEDAGMFWSALFFCALAVWEIIWVLHWCCFQYEEHALVGIQQSLLHWGVSLAGIGVLGERWAKRLDHCRWPNQQTLSSNRLRWLGYLADQLLLPLEIAAVAALLPIAARLWLQRLQYDTPQEAFWIRILVWVAQLLLLGIVLVRHWPLCRKLPSRLLRGKFRAWVLAASCLVGLCLVWRPVLAPTGVFAETTALNSDVIALATELNGERLVVASAGKSREKKPGPTATTLQIFKLPGLQSAGIELENQQFEGDSLLQSLAFQNGRLTLLRRTSADPAGIEFVVWNEAKDWRGDKLVRGSELGLSPTEYVRMDVAGRVLAVASGSSLADLLVEPPQASSNERKVRLFDSLESAVETIEYPALKEISHVHSFILSSNGKYLAIYGTSLPPEKKSENLEETLPDYLGVPDSLFVIERSTGQVIAKPPMDAGYNASWIEFSANGERLAMRLERRLPSIGPGPVWIIDPINRQGVLTLHDVPGQIAWSPNGRQLAFRQEHSLEVYSARNAGSPLVKYRVPQGEFTCHAFSPDSKWLLAGGSQGQVWAYPTPGEFQVMWQLSALRPDDYDAAMTLWNSTPGVRANESREEFERILSRNPGFCTAARKDDELVGAVFCCHDGRRGYLYHLAVAPHCRGLGIGRELVTESLTRLKAIGITRCTIFVIQDNHAGNEFWQHLGWRERVDLKAMAFDLT